MDLSADVAPGGATHPFQEDLRRISAEVVDTHRHCDVGNPQKCDLYHHLIEIMKDLAEGVRKTERALMICGHPAACAHDGPCMACAREARLLSEAGGMAKG